MLKVKQVLLLATITAILLASIINLNLQPASATPEPAWLTGWQYRKRFTVTGAANAGIGYQMMIKVRRGSGTDTGNIVYVGDKCKSDFTDIRFTDSEANVFPCWIFTASADEAKIWVKVNVDLSADRTLYMYYGNPDAPNISSLDETFIFAETFSESTLNPRWTVISANSYTIEPGFHRITFSGVQTVHIVSTLMNISFPSYYVVESWDYEQYASNNYYGSFKMGQQTSKGSGTSTKTRLGIHVVNASESDWGVVWSGFDGWDNYNGFTAPRAGVGHNQDYAGSAGGVEEYIERSWRWMKSDNYIQVYVEGSRVINESNTEAPNRVYMYYKATMGGVGRIYGFKIRKYVEPEPYVSYWYAEESATATRAYISVNVEPLWLGRVAFTLDYPQQLLFTPYDGAVDVGDHILSVVDSQLTLNNTHVYGFKCWKKNGMVVSFDEDYSFSLVYGEVAEFTMVYIAYNVSIVSEPEMYVKLEVGGWEVQTPTNIYRGPGYYFFEATTLTVYYNSTHVLNFFGWYVDNIFVSSATTVNVYISYDTTVKLVYRASEIPAPPPMTFKANIVELGQLKPGEVKDFALTILFDANTITIESIQFQAKPEWFTVTDALPAAFSRGTETITTATINARLTVPETVTGYYNLPFTVTATTPQNQRVTTGSYITFTVTAQPTVTETTVITGGFTETINRLIGNPLLLLLMIALIIWLATYTLKKH